ncbi:MAG: cell division protein FtsQ/DivIB [Burkholderiales bacterium]|jgi:cell division protein FtsQ
MNFWHDPRLMNLTAMIAAVLAALSLVYATFVAIMRLPAFDFRSIEVRASKDQGLRHVNLPALRANALPGLKGGFFTLNLETARRQFETVPWVRRAQIARHWPDRLVVMVEEHVPLALWVDGRGINTYGEWFAANPAEFEQYGNLPELNGPSGTEQYVAQRFRHFTDWFAPLDLKPQVVELSPRYAWRITMTNQVVVELGREQNDKVLKYRVDRLIAHYDEIKTRWGAAPTQVDLRYPNGFAIKVSGVKFLSEPAVDGVLKQ